MTGMFTNIFPGRDVCLVIAAAFFAAASSAGQADTVELGELGAKHMSSGWKTTNKNFSVEGHPLKIGGQTFEKGMGTHACSSMRIDLLGSATRFTATVGVDDDVAGKGSVVFTVRADGNVLWTSKLMKGGQAAKSVDVDLSGRQMLLLTVTDGGDGVEYDHADWVNGVITYTGKAPKAAVAPIEEAVILTPPPPALPRICGAKVFGARPGSPFLHTIAATGERPMTFSAEGLPAGLTLDASTGQITGKVEKAGEFKVAITAGNAKGQAKRELKIVIGDNICLTPPMGWNSWNCWGGVVSQEKVLSSAKAMVDKGLINHGWTYINIDDGWQGVRGGPFNAIQCNKKFPDMAGLAGAIHGMGLKVGIYSTPWRGSYEGHIGSSCDNEDGTYDWVKEGKHNEFYKFADRSKNYKFGKHSFVKADVQQWAAWSIDYLKYDWHVIDPPHVQEMSDALRACGRDIAYSLSNSAPFANGPVYVKSANAWRTTGDINDSWGSMSGIGFAQDKWAVYAGPGHWNDPDMLVVGKVGWGRPHATKLTPNEQYTHISLWCLLAAPLLIGCDMAQLDDFTLNLLTNDEVLDVDQDALGAQGRQVARTGFTQVWAKPLEDGSLAVGLFNLDEWESPVTVTWKELKIEGERTVRDLWRQKDLGKMSDKFQAVVPRHGVVLVKISK